MGLNKNRTTPESCENTEQELVQTTKITQRPWVLVPRSGFGFFANPSLSLVFPLLCKVIKIPHQDSPLLLDSTQSRATPSFLQRSPENPLLHGVLPEPSLCDAPWIPTLQGYSTAGVAAGLGGVGVQWWWVEDGDNKIKSVHRGEKLQVTLLAKCYLL